MSYSDRDSLVSRSEIENFRNSLEKLIESISPLNKERIIKEIILILKCNSSLNKGEEEKIEKFKTLQYEEKEDKEFVEKIEQDLQYLFDIDVSDEEYKQLEIILEKYLESEETRKNFRDFLLSCLTIFDTAIQTVEKIPDMSKEVGELGQQIKGFNTESERLKESIKLYGERVEDHAKKVDSLASKESVDNLNDNFKRFRDSDFKDFKEGFQKFRGEDFGSSDSGKGFANTVNQRFSELETKLNSKTDEKSDELTKLIKGEQLDGKGGVEGNLKQLIQGTNFDGKSGLEGKINNLESKMVALSGKVGKAESKLIRVNIGGLLLVFIGGFMSLTGFIRGQVQDNIGPLLNAELSKEDGIKSQIDNNTKLLEKISEKLNSEISSESQQSEPTN